MADTQILVPISRQSELEPVLLAALAKQGIDKSRITLTQDYGKSIKGVSSPYAQIYADSLSRQKFMIVSALPMVDAYGQAHELAWTDKNGVIENGNNIFHSVIDKGTCRLLTLSDQPNGTQKDDEVNFHPQLFIDGVEILPLSDAPRLLEIDPINENYHYNVLEWDYGVCRRRVRLIEGSFLGSWVFLTSPKGDVHIKYNQSGLGQKARPEGKLKLRLQYAKDEDTEFIPETFFDQTGEYPVTLSDSLTFYTTALDGQTYNAGAVYATVHNASNSQSVNTTDTYLNISNSLITTTYYVLRGHLYFDTSSLGAGSTISAATLSLYGYIKAQADAGQSDLCIVEGTFDAANDGLAVADFGAILANTTRGSDTDYDYTSFSTSAYNNKDLNATGIGWISKTGMTKFALRVKGDIDISTPSGLNRVLPWSNEKGAGYQPKLVVTYTTGVTEKSSAEAGSGAEAKTSGHPIVVTSGTEMGSGAEAALKIAAFLSDDAGLGSEISWMQKEALAGDNGGGTDALKALKKTADSSSDMRLSGRAGQAGMPSKQVKMPSKGVNI